MAAKRFAAHLLYFDCEQFILRAIDNLAPWVERFFVAYSPKPWSYNAGARANFGNPSNPAILEQSPHRSRIELICGEWGTEEAQRNECVERARAQGFDFLIIQDPDEFYLPVEFEKNLAGIEAQPDWPYYRNPWHLFWKTTGWVLLQSFANTYKRGRLVSSARNTLLNYNACFALNLRTDIRFSDRRLPSRVDDYLMLPGICHHLSFVMNDDQMWRKVNTWGHSHEFDRKLWYDVKWLGWTPDTRDLSLLMPTEFRRAVAYNGILPEQIADFDPGPQAYRQPVLSQRLRAWMRARREKTRHVMRSIYARLRRRDTALKTP